MTVYDAMAPDFDRHRALPDGVPEAVRTAILGAALPAQPRVLDLGAGTGRIGRCFVQAGDDYTGADLSFGMLRDFASHIASPGLVQAEGARLPFPDATFDAVLLIQVLNAAGKWRDLLTDAMRVLRPAGALVVGRVIAPDDGIDARMKATLAAMLAALNTHPYRDKPFDDALSWLLRRMPDPVVMTAASWTAERRADAFLRRHSTGARFSRLDEAVRRQAMGQLADWARQTIGPLDTVFTEHHRFELIIHRSCKEPPL